MIEDLELRTLFKTESEEHLRLLEEGLLRLESNPTDGQMLEEVFRGAHSLKGGAGMLGLRSIERLAHGFEDGLNAARHGNSSSPPRSSISSATNWTPYASWWTRPSRRHLAT
jgi:two-component system, chemotaxis family, sensor kinase CheA